MNLRTLFWIPFAFSLLVSSSHEHNVLITEQPIDAISFSVHNTEQPVLVSYKDGDTWSAPQAIGIGLDANPGENETDLIIFPQSVSSLRIQNFSNVIGWNTLISSKDAVSYQTSAITPVGTPKILQRRQWGADESFTIHNGSSSRTTNTERGDSTLTSREAECNQLQAKYPEDFRTVNASSTNAAGQQLRWSNRYSPRIKAIVVHHTAATYSTDTRSGWEKMRLLYAYHANSKGWGDIGYHYLIDESGQIYEGKAGGKYIVGGHAYCSNVGTIGVALMGNFNEEQPTIEQTRSLQWLLLDLSSTYNIPLGQKVQYQGELIDTIVGHKDVVATQCPGEALDDALPQIRRNVAVGSYRALVRYPNVGTSSVRRPTRTLVAPTIGVGRSATQIIGSTTHTNRPGASITIQVLVSAWTQPIALRQNVATISRSDTQIGVWQYFANGQSVRVRDKLLATKNLVAGQSVTIPVRVQLPRQAGRYTLDIGQATVTLNVEGRRTPTVSNTNTRAPVTDTAAVSQRGRTTVQSIPTTRVRPVFYRSTTAPVASVAQGNGAPIRIKLSYPSDTATIEVGPNGGSLDGNAVRGTIRFSERNGSCLAVAGLQESVVASPRLISHSDELTISSWETKFNRFRGTIECQIEAGKIILINELPIEEYLWGLAEEPDTEPYEKQRAFAIAARSYAAHYMQPQYRKFPGKQYDGSDSPAVFQKYGGIKFEEDHPEWVKAVKTTAHIVVKKDGQIVKTPYFSSDDGRTRSPAENGWANFLFAEVFSSKPDPWCQGNTLRGHGVGMSGCGSKGMALEGKTGEQILEYYYPTTQLQSL